MIWWTKSILSKMRARHIQNTCRLHLECMQDTSGTHANVTLELSCNVNYGNYTITIKTWLYFVGDTISDPSRFPSSSLVYVLHMLKVQCHYASLGNKQIKSVDCFSITAFKNWFWQYLLWASYILHGENLFSL